MKILSLNVKHFDSYKGEARSLRRGKIVTVVKLFLCAEPDGVVILEEIPYGDWNGGLTEAMGKGYHVICAETPKGKRAWCYTVAICAGTEEALDWKQQKQQGFLEIRKNTEDYKNRFVELWNERHKLRLLGIHAPLAEERPKDWKKKKCEWDEDGVYIPTKGFFDDLKKYADTHTGEEKCIILGDMNVHSEEDCYYYRKFEDIQKEDEYIDLVLPKTPTYFKNGHTIDHVLISPALKGKVNATVVAQEVLELSDHAVIIVDVQEEKLGFDNHA